MVATNLKQKDMKDEIKDFIKNLEGENKKRTEKLNDPNISQYSNTVNVHEYNLTLEIIKKLTTIVNKY